VSGCLVCREIVRVIGLCKVLLGINSVLNMVIESLQESTCSCVTTWHTGTNPMRVLACIQLK
jgi:hypothetical protein